MKQGFSEGARERDRVCVCGVTGRPCNVEWLHDCLVGSSPILPRVRVCFQAHMLLVPLPLLSLPPSLLLLLLLLLWQAPRRPR